MNGNDLPQMALQSRKPWYVKETQFVTISEKGRELHSFFLVPLIWV